MATTVGSHSVSAFATPVNGGPLDANVVRGNDNTIRTAYVAHDADTGIHVQSSTLASRPVAGTAGRKWITADTGVYKLWYDDGTTWHEVAAGNIDVFVIAGEALVKGDVVKVTGYNNGTGAPIVAKVASASDTAFGIVNSTTIANGATGYITNTGLILDVATNAFSIGDILYPNTSGGFTATKPTSGNYQPVAFVLRSNANNGVLYVEFSSPRIVERSNNQASTIVLRDASGNFSAGTITAGAVTSTGLVTFASLKGTGATTVTNILDEDNMASDSATALATQQSIKAYVDAKVATVDTLAEVLANGNTTGANNIIVTAGQKITTNTIDETTSGSGVTIDSVLLKDDVVNATDIETGTVSANDGTTSATIANSTGVMTIASSVLTTTDINGGTIDGTTIGGSSAAAGTFTTVAATTGNITTVNATTVDATSVEVTNVKAKDGTASITIADSTGALTLSSALADSNLATISTAGKVANSATTATSANTNSAIVARDSSGNFSAGTITANLTGNISGTAPAGTLTGTTLAANVVSSSLTSVGTLSSLTVSGDLTVDTSTLKVDSTNNRVGIGTASPAYALDVVGTSATALRIRGSSASTNNTAMRFFGVNANADMWAIGNAVSTNDTTRIFEIYDLVASASRVSLDASGNLGLGVTPSAWSSDAKAFQFSGGALSGFQTSQVNLTQNAFLDASANFVYVTSAAASAYRQISGAHSWLTAASGTAGNAISFGDAKMTLNASGNLGVGTTSPAGRLDVHALNATVANSGNIGVYTTDSQTVDFGGSLALGGLADTTIQFAKLSGRKENGTANNRDGYLQFATFKNGVGIAERARITSGGRLLVGTTTENASGGVIQVSNGITFPATQSASSDANTLDDYEEGEFTPTATFTTPGTVSTASAVGVYTKIGNVVTVMGRIAVTKGTASGDVVMGGLPFASINRSTYQVPGSLSVDDFGVAGKVYYILLVNNSTAPILQTQTQSTGVVATSTAADFYAGAGTIRYSFTYHV